MALSLADIHRLEAADGWLERKEWANCFDELESIDYNNRDDAREKALRWKLYNASGQHVPAANMALGIQRRFPNEPAGYVWRSMSLDKLGCTEDAYEQLELVAGKFDGLGIVPYLLAVYACELQRLNTTHAWLLCAFNTPDSKELRLQALDDPRLETFWRKIGQL
jgi:hypothetical protein